MEPEIMVALFRKLADSHSQRNIASLLNERELYRPGGYRWDQSTVSRFMKAHGIESKFTWKGWS